MKTHLKNGEIAMPGVNCPPDQGDIILWMRISQSGQFEVRGPIQNKLLSYGMMELAKEYIANPPPTPDPNGVAAAQPEDVAAMAKLRKNFIGGM